MAKFEDIIKDEALTKQKFETIEKQLSEIKEKQDRLEQKIDKLMFLLPKRDLNHDRG